MLQTLAVVGWEFVILVGPDRHSSSEAVAAAWSRLAVDHDGASTIAECHTVVERHRLPIPVHHHMMPLTVANIQNLPIMKLDGVVKRSVRLRLEVPFKTVLTPGSCLSTTMTTCQRRLNQRINVAPLITICDAAVRRCCFALVPGASDLLHDVACSDGRAAAVDNERRRDAVSEWTSRMAAKHNWFWHVPMS